MPIIISKGFLTDEEMLSVLSKDEQDEFQQLAPAAHTTNDTQAINRFKELQQLARERWKRSNSV